MATTTRARAVRAKPTASRVAPSPQAGEERKAADAVADDAPDEQERIRLLAYRLYEERGHAPGHALEDWVRAEMLVHQTPKTTQ